MVTGMRELLKHIYYGDELNRLHEGVSITRQALCRFRPEFSALTVAEWDVVGDVTREFFGVRREGVFGGQITAGDGWFIGAWMAAIRPQAMIEVGVASGFSSALILSFAERLDLLGNNGTAFLHSFDLMEVHANGGVTGDLLRRYFPHFEKHWNLTTKTTTAQMSFDALREMPLRTMAFLDGGHNHPWPTIDLAYLRRAVPQCEWALMQDTAMMERWIADAVIYQVPVPKPVRGVQLALNHWPGDKLVGTGPCYNMAAVRVPIGDVDETGYLKAVRTYPYECNSDQAEICDEFFAKL